MTLNTRDFGQLVASKRGARGVRVVAAEVGTSHSTLSRVENGHMPDLQTFAKLCRWLERDPREFLGLDADRPEAPRAVVHFRKKKTVAAETAMALGELMLAAQHAVQARSSIDV